MRIAFVGPFGDANFGDYAMLVNNIYSLGKHEYTVFSYNTGLLSLLNDTYLNGYSIEECQVVVNTSYQEVLSDKYRVEYCDYAYTPIEIIDKIGNLTEIEEKIKNIDKLIVCGGGYFNRVWSAMHRQSKLMAIMGVVLLADACNKKIVFTGNTFGPFDSSDELFASFFNSLSNVTFAARDNLYSASNLRKIGVDSFVQILPDDLYFLEKDFGNFDIDKRTKENLPEKYIILELYSSMEEIMAEMEEIKAFITAMNEKYSLKVVFLPLDKGYGGENQAKLIKKNIPELYYVDLGENEFRKVEDVLYILRHSQMVVCQRYHMFLFAMANNIPAFLILKDVCGDKRYYYTKVSGLLRLIFSDQIINESMFMTLNIKVALKKVQDDYFTLVQTQKEYMNEKKKDAEEKLRSVRKRYLEENILH